MADKNVTMTFHIDPDLKRDVTEIVKDYGLNLTAVTRAFYKQIVREGAIPLSFRYDAKGIDDPDAMLGASAEGKASVDGQGGFFAQDFSTHVEGGKRERVGGDELIG